ncbi:flavoprotein [Streptomyces carminius]|uniref:Flavoprotein n=1 Tax=Streptomyces carminius TaxID=2665496 RepID=A0A2M8LR25_9ACTN|nr:flavoprotein [Streptomyces carminius]PJE94411.1 flavoprotein [Streptomyces carminius]
MKNRVLYLLGCAAPPVVYADRAVRDAQARGWDVCLGVTPTARDWLGDRLPELERLTGHPVRSAYRALGTPDVWPRADVVVVAPATLNTVNACALGIATTFVAGFTMEAIGKRVPLVVMPCVNSAYARHPQFGRSLETLREAGVRVLYGPGGFEPNPPGRGRPEEYPWRLALAAAEEAAGGGDGNAGDGDAGGTAGPAG